jgi:hypothetical protein
MIGISIAAFKRRDWIGHGITYFFSWLAFWILLLNPPFGDFTNPTIQSVSVSPFHPGYTGTLSCQPLVSGAVTIKLNPPNTSAYVLFRASDNVGLASVQVEVTPNSQPAFVLNATPQIGSSRCANHTTETYPGGTYNVSFVFNASSYIVTIVARDRSGRIATDSFQIFHN